MSGGVSACPPFHGTVEEALVAAASGFWASTGHIAAELVHNYLPELSSRVQSDRVRAVAHPPSLKQKWAGYPAV